MRYNPAIPWNTVKDDPVFRAYRDFFWSVGVDPTKTRPASEALVRRILSGGKLPRINTAVDAYNLASVRSGIPIAAFDSDTLTGDLTLRFASDGELFLGIGMERPVVLQKNQVIMTDERQIIAIYPYRDSDTTKVTPETRNIRIITCGVPKIGIGRGYLPPPMSSTHHGTLPGHHPHSISGFEPVCLASNQ